MPTVWRPAPSQIELISRSDGIPARSLACLTARREGPSNKQSTRSSSVNNSDPKYVTAAGVVGETVGVARCAIVSRSASVTPGQ